jgi:hypothetical protein
VQADLQKVPLSQINASPGVLRLVTFGEDPQPIPHKVIEEIAERSKLMDTLKHEPFRPGDLVRVKHGGPLQDLEMIFMGPTTGSHRVSVLLNFLGRLKQVHLDEETLEKVSSRSFDDGSIIESYSRRERYIHEERGEKLGNRHEGIPPYGANMLTISKAWYCYTPHQLHCHNRVGVYAYIEERRLPAVRAAHVIMIPVEEVKKFNPKISGRPRIPDKGLAKREQTC